MVEHAVKSPLCDLITRHANFDFGEFIAHTPAADYDHWNGYCLPVQYSQADKEYDAIRNGCGLFDASPMKKYRFNGADAGRFLDRLLTARVSHQPSMKAIYSLMCNDDGFLIDDGMVFKLAEDDYLYLITETNHDAYFTKYNRFDDLKITDESSSLFGLALQGPKSCAILSQFGFEKIEALKPFHLGIYQLDSIDIIAGRVGFTGDLGYEIWFPPAALPAVERALNAAEHATGVKALGYGLAAVQMGRLDAGMIVPGWDTANTFEDDDRERTPLELTLGWNVKLDRDDEFVGKSALRKQKATGLRFKMKGVRIFDKAHMEEGDDVFAEVDGKRQKIGTIPSLIWHTADQCWIGFVSLKPEFASLEEAYVMREERMVACNICKLPFIDLERRTATPAAL